ncbi:erythromycin esterase family protein [Leeuwenhoekiella sp. H156]|uniref:erythromycin esterase family protein n=1 Tax=Leeuwenhoekiella sp. H156 TaxID=3450128 RepID=UPI003FA40B72
MKLKYTFLFCILSLITRAQDLKIHELLPPETNQISDLSFLETELKNRQLVMLGEQTHMYGNIFEMKARIVEYLHQQLGFKTIAIESPMYDIWKINQSDFDSKKLNDAVWGVWSNTTEFQRLVNYIKDNDLKVIGFDTQIINTQQFIEDFFDFLENRELELKLDEDDMGIIIEGVLDNGAFDEEDINFNLYENELKRILRELEKSESDETNYYWNQFIKNLLACSRDAYYNTEEILTTDFANKNYNIRDAQMADNLLSYLGRNPDEKILVWADNIHIINDMTSIKKPVVKEFLPMGSYIHKALREKAYSLATLHANDSLFDLGTKKWEATPVKKGSFEYELSSFTHPYLFITSSQEAMHRTRDTRLLNFIDFTEARLDELYDGYVFLKNAKLPIGETPKDTVNIPKRPLVNTKKINPVKNGENLILKGQVLDTKSGKPVPFATLILKSEEVYRVADEEGYFELPVKKEAMQTALLELSSLGFETRKIALKDLNEQVYLEPKFEELNEVVITGYLSPLAVLKKAISKKKTNHPVDPFNFQRYGKVILNTNDTNELDFEVVTKDYDRGYLSPYVITQKVEQIKWNTNRNPEKYQNTGQFFSYRQNAIRYSNILHKRKYKKFELNFIKSNQPEDENTFIIAFQTERNKWNYTNRGYPTSYSGRVYIDKQSFAIVKVVENWETTLNRDEIKIYYKGYPGYDDIQETTIKEENVCTYSPISDDGKYYANRYFNRKYSEFLNTENKRSHRILELDSYLFDFELNDVETIEFEWKQKDQSLLNRVNYNPAFWDSFYEKLRLSKIN